MLGKHYRLNYLLRLSVEVSKCPVHKMDMLCAHIHAHTERDRQTEVPHTEIILRALGTALLSQHKVPQEGRAETGARGGGVADTERSQAKDFSYQRHTALKVLGPTPIEKICLRQLGETEKIGRWIRMGASTWSPQKKKLPSELGLTWELGPQHPPSVPISSRYLLEQ